jgi:diguanylate cyclase (GGDEF)-like protein/PAS domain S-box-containing protein
MVVRSLAAPAQVLAALPMAALVVNETGEIVLVNPAAVELFGEAAGELVGRQIVELIPGGFAAAQSVVEREIAGPAQVRRIARVTTSPLGGDGLYLALVEPIVAGDRYYVAFREAASGIVFVAKDGCILDVNPRFCAITGYDEHELRGTFIQRLSYPDDRQIEVPGIHRVMAGEIPSFSVEKRYLRRDGRAIWVQLEISYVADPSGEGSYLSQVIEVTERKKAERRSLALAAARRALEGATAIEDALPEVLGHVADAAGWACCEYWVLVDETFKRRAAWREADLDGTAFADSSRDAISYDAAAIRRLFAKGEPFWVADIQARRDAAPRQDAIEAGFASLCWAPLFDGDTISAVIVGFSRVRQDADPALAADLLRFGRFLGQVVERRRAEQRLRLSDRAVQDTTSGILIADATQANLPILSVNPAVCRITGYDEAELAGRSVSILEGPETDTTVIQDIMTAIHDGRDTQVTLRSYRKGGEPFWNEMTMSPIRDEHGRITHVIGVLQDISARVESEQQLRESEAQLAEAQAIAHIGSWSYDSRTKQLRCSPEGWRLFGVEDLRDDERTQECLNRIHPDDRFRFNEAAEQSRREGQPVTLDLRIVLPGRYVRTVQFVVQSVQDETGASTRTRGTMMDVTESRLAEKALRESEALQRSVVASLEEGVIVEDTRGFVHLWNAAAERITGLTAAQMVGREPPPAGWLVVREDGTPVPPEEQPGAVAQRTGTSQVGVVLGFTKPGGVTTWCSVTSQPLIRPGEVAPYVIVHSYRDITASRSTAAALMAANDQLTAQVGALEARTHEISLLSELGELLASCQTTDEAYAIIAQLGRELFPGTVGMLAMTDERGLVVPVSHWGAPAVDEAFDERACWALRRGRPHLVQEQAGGLRCSHVQTAAPYLCLPVLAQGETLGLLHIAQVTGPVPDDRQQLGATVAEHVALALSNLRLRESLRSQSIRDPLTDLYNRRYLEEALRIEGRRHLRNGRGLALLMLDIDHFKQFNDRFGHEAGDMLLREFGRLLKSHIRGGDIACRYGGEEFTIILPEIGADEAVQRANDIRDAVMALRVAVRGRPLGPLTCSIGVALFPDHAQTVDECLMVADRALYRAKAAGRNCVVLAD